MIGIIYTTNKAKAEQKILDIIDEYANQQILLEKREGNDFYFTNEDCWSILDSPSLSRGYGWHKCYVDELLPTWVYIRRVLPAQCGEYPPVLF